MSRVAVCLTRGLAALLLCIAPSGSAGQTVETLVPPGTRVRLWAVGGYRADGSLLTLSRDSIVLRSEEAGRVGLHVGSLRRLEARLPTGSRWRATWRGLLAGATVGVVATGAAAIIEGGALDVPIAVPLLVGSTAAGGIGGAFFLRGHAWRVIPLSSFSR
ncbi:MAG: hypothetical protein PVH00_00820 [Gemmatimonadota bacterium]